MTALHCGLPLITGEQEVVEWLIASGRDLGDVKNKEGKDWWDGKYYTALEIARKKKNEVA